jgi:DNA-binding NarL/FixJ family response regulator
MYPRSGNISKTQFNTSESALSDVALNGNGGVDQNVHSEQRKIALIGASSLLQECFLPALSERLPFAITALQAVDDLLQEDAASYDLIVLFAPGKEPRHSIAAAKTLLDQMGQPPPFAVLADSEEADEVLAAFEGGARAYIPTSVTFDVMIEAIKLVIAGGTYCPPCILSLCVPGGEAKDGSVHALTPREMAVLKAVRQGLPNKLIAQELGISESTIKVHVHRLMKKLKVQNRTQAAICVD